jgi:hypothetical protein
MDIPYTVRRKGRKVALHVEFQKQQDDDMGRRVWEYNVLACVRTGLPVYSVVLYLVKDAPIVESPYTVELSADEIIHHFVFQNVKLWEIPPEVLIEQKLPGLLPLLPLTQDGKRREVAEQMMRILRQVGKEARRLDEDLCLRVGTSPTPTARDCGSPYTFIGYTFAQGLSIRVSFSSKV